MVPSNMENFALSLNKFLLMPSDYTHQEKLFDMSHVIYGLHGNRVTPLFISFRALRPAAITLH